MSTKEKRIPDPQFIEGPDNLTKTSLLYWWPKVKDLGIPVPRTEILIVDRWKILGAMEGEGPFDMEPIRTFAAQLTYPLFLRTDLQSGKHGWKDTCYVPSPNLLERNMFGVAQENELGACCFGPSYHALVFREFLDLDATFTAFYGEMPINRERRYFIQSGRVICHHPYWPELSIKNHTKDRKWRNKLEELNYELQEEIDLLSEYAIRVSAVLPEYWSVDFAKTKDGTWYLIDMALGSESFHWPDCKRKPEEK